MTYEKALQTALTALDVTIKVASQCPCPYCNEKRKECEEAKKKLQTITTKHPEK